MFTNNLHSFGIRKSIADFQNFNSAQEKNVASSSSQINQVSVDFPKFLNLTGEKESLTSTPDKLGMNMAQAKKKKRKRVYSPRKKRKKVTSECDGQDTDETVNWDLEELAKEASGKGQEFDSSTADLNDLPFMTVGQELEKEIKNTQTRKLIETGAKYVLNEENLLGGTSSNLTDIWRINSNSNLNMTLRKDQVLHKKTDSKVKKDQNMFPLLPATQKSVPSFQQDTKSVQMLMHESPPVLTQEEQNLTGSVLKTLLMPVLPANPNSFPTFLPSSSSVNTADKSSLARNASVKAVKKSMKVSNNAGVLIRDSKSHQYRMIFPPNSPQQPSTAYANLLHFTNKFDMKNDQNKIASHSRLTSTFPTQMNFHQTRFPSLINCNVKTDSNNMCNSSNRDMINEQNDYVYDMDFEVEPEKDSCENLIPPTLIKEERISDEENLGNFDKQIPKINATVTSDSNPSISVSSKMSVIAHTILGNEKLSNVSSTEEIEENLPLSHYLKKVGKDGTGVEKINSKNVLSQKTTSAPELDHILMPNAKKQPKANQKATYSGGKSPRKKGAKKQFDLFPGSANESCSSTSNVIQADNGTCCEEKIIVPKQSKVVGKSLDNSTCIMRTENLDMHVEMSFEEDVCDKQSHMENVKDLLTFPNVQESTNCLNKNETQSKTDSLPLLPFIKTEPIFTSNCATESDKLPEHGHDVKSAADILDKSHEVQNENTVENNTPSSTKSNPKRVYHRKRVRKAGGKKKKKTAKLDEQSKNDEEMTSDEHFVDASLPFASELPVNNVPTVSENGSENLLKHKATIDEVIEKHNTDSITTTTEDETNSVIDKDSISTNFMNTIREDGETKSNKNQNKKKRNRKKTSWYPKKRKSTPKKKVAEKDKDRDLGSQTEIAAENVETLNEDNFQNNQSNISNLKQTVNTSLKVIENSKNSISTFKRQEYLQTNSVSLNQKNIDASATLTQKAEEISNFSSVNSTHKANNNAELSTENDRNKVRDNRMPVSIDELGQTLSFIKKEKEDPPETNKGNENLSGSSNSKLNSQNDVAKNLSESSSNDTANTSQNDVAKRLPESSGNDTANSSLNLIGGLLSIKTEKPDELIAQCTDNISCKTTEAAAAAFITSKLNTGHPKNANVCENTTGHKINQKQYGDSGLNPLIGKDNEKSTEIDFSSKSNNSENIRQTITCAANSLLNTHIPVNQDSAPPTNPLEGSEFMKVLQSIKKEKGEEEKTSKNVVNSKEICSKTKTGSLFDKTKSDLERTIQYSSQSDKTVCPIQKKMPAADVTSLSNSGNINAHFPDVINPLNSSKHTLSSNKEILTQNKDLISNCREALTEKEGTFSENNNLVNYQSKSSQSIHQDNNISVSIAHIKKREGYNKC